MRKFPRPQECVGKEKCLKQVNPDIPGVFFGTPFEYDPRWLGCHHCTRGPILVPPFASIERDEELAQEPEIKKPRFTRGR